MGQTLGPGTYQKSGVNAHQGLEQSLLPDAFVCQSVIVCLCSKEFTAAGKSMLNTKVLVKIFEENENPLKRRLVCT